MERKRKYIFICKSKELLTKIKQYEKIYANPSKVQA